MNGPRQVYLDLSGDNPAPPGSAVVDDPVSFLKHALGQEPLLVREEALRQWARDFGRGRGWHTEDLRSIADELREQCPDLTADQARLVLEGLGDRLRSLPRPLSLVDVATARWGNAWLWNADPAPKHAFRWLAWLVRQNDEPGLALIGPFARHWEAVADPLLRRAYAAGSPADAWRLLEEWLRVVPSPQEWPAPPSGLDDDLARRLAADLQRQAIVSETDFFVALRDRAPTIDVLRQAARACWEVLRAHPAKATADRVARLESYLPYEQWHELAALAPPPLPVLPDWQFGQLARWFEREYLPYRIWATRQGDGGADDPWATRHAREFARGFLDYYAAARQGGDGAEHLGPIKSRRLRDHAGEAISLLIILDGASVADARRLADNLANEAKRLRLDAEDLMLAPLPTITSFAKPAMARGAMPSQAADIADPRTYTSSDDVIAALQTARSGDVLVWEHTEPDRSYHFRGDGTLRSVRHQVDAQLMSLARQIAEVVGQAPEPLQLRVIVTADHGRLLSRVARSEAVPQGMQAHGRAAWGPSRLATDPCGYRIEGDLVYLHPTRFAMPEGYGYAVIVSERAFVTADERGGVEPFPHGGLFPEEVLIPWLEYSRDRGPVRLTAVLRGAGEAGKPGTAALEITNESPLEIGLIGLKLPRLQVNIALADRLAPLVRQELAIALPLWPTRAEAEGLTAILTYVQPGGEPGQVEVATELTVESLYERSDLLRELGDL